MRRYRLFLIPFILASTTIYSQESGSKAANSVSTDSDVIDIVATGIGSTQDAALKNAFQNAVESAIGLYVDAHTRIQNEQILQDEILTHSNGFVDKFEKLSEEKRSDGLYECRINAHVRKNQIVDKLKMANIISTNVDTSSLYAKIVTNNQSTKDAQAILASTLTKLNYPVSILRARVAGSEPKLLEKNDISAKVAWPIEITIDEEMYFNNIVPALKQVLGQVAVKQASMDAVRNAKRTRYDGFTNPLYDHSIIDDTNMKAGLISVITKKSNLGDNMTLWWCNLNNECWTTLFEHLAPCNSETGNTQPIPPLHIAWLDKNGVAVIEDAVSILSVSGRSYTYGFTQFGKGPDYGLRLGPFIYNGCYFVDTFSFSYARDVSLEDLKRIVQMKCYFTLPVN